MQKPILSLSKALCLLITLSLLWISCKKENNKKPFKLNTKTSYRVSPKAPEEIIMNGTTFIGNAFFPGGGTGNATHLGKVNIFFNQQVYSNSEGGSPMGSVAAPIKDVPGYPVLGGQLPLIQPGDFDELAAINASLQIPSQIYGHIVNSVIYNKKGDAVFLSAITGEGATFPISKTLVGFNGKALIIDGRGKFTNAKGEVDYEGYFNVADANDAEYNAKGWISY